MPDIIFSHKKHTVWNWMRTLPSWKIFMGVKKGNSHYTMVDISQGKLRCLPCDGRISADGLPTLPHKIGTTLSGGILMSKRGIALVLVHGARCRHRVRMRYRRSRLVRGRSRSSAGGLAG